MTPRPFRRSQFRDERFRSDARPIIEAAIRARYSCRALVLSEDADYLRFDHPPSGAQNRPPLARHLPWRPIAIRTAET